MEDVLDLYAEPEDPKRPRVCVDERPYQLISETRQPLPGKPGRPQRYDYEYTREGTCNLFMFVQPHVGWRHVQVTDRRTKADFAPCMKDLVDLHVPDADCIRVILDHLNTHTPAVRYEAFEPAEARRIICKLSFTLRPSTAVGSTWRKSSSPSWPGSAWIAGCRTRPRSVRKWRPGRRNATPSTRRSTGASRLTRRVQNWSTFIHHNQCGKVLVLKVPEKGGLTVGA